MNVYERKCVLSEVLVGGLISFTSKKNAIILNIATVLDINDRGIKLLCINGLEHNIDFNDFDNIFII